MCNFPLLFIVSVQTVCFTALLLCDLFMVQEQSVLNTVVVHGNHVVKGKGKSKSNKLGHVCIVRCYILFPRLITCTGCKMCVLLFATAFVQSTFLPIKYVGRWFSTRVWKYSCYVYSRQLAVLYNCTHPGSM
jgi:hypothetical protein